MLHNNFSAEFDYLDDEIELFQTARKIKASHVYGDEAVAGRKVRPKGECRKVRFRSRKDALDAVRSIKYDQFRLLAPENRDAKLPRRAYRCHECRNGYHLTSKVWAPYSKGAKVITLKRPEAMGLLGEIADVA